jgi:hypothetical protein
MLKPDMGKAAMVRVFSFAALIALISADAAEAQTSRPSGQNRVMIVYTNPSLDGMSKHESFQSTPARIARAQAELRSNDALRSELLRRNIQLRNVIAVDEARNGRWTVYMR